MIRNANVSFCNVLYRNMIPDIKKFDKTIKLSDAWVYKCGQGAFEFHYKEFYWCGNAYCASDARYKGWSAYLRKQGVEEYQIPSMD